MITPAQENERMLARILGIGEDEAAVRLAQTVAITACGGEAAVFAAELKAQLEQTVSIAGPGAACDLEILIHAPPARKATQRLAVAIQEDCVVIGSAVACEKTAPTLHGVQCILAACYAASVALSSLIHGIAPASSPDPFVVDFGALDATPRVLAAPVRLSDAALAGAGAVSNGFLRAAHHLDISGALTVLDPKAVGGGNPNRCLYFDMNDIGAPKAERLCAKAAADFPHLTLKPETTTFADFVKRHGAVRRVIVATDSRQARRSIQSDLPLEVLDASTTGVSEVIVHSHRQPTQHACLACVYHHIGDELARQHAIAEGLGIPSEEVLAGGLIDARIAAHIVARHPTLDEAALVGMAFDSLYKQLCAEQTLLTAAGEQVLAPFAFVSSLAGALLALELARFDSGQRFLDGRNYLFTSPWSPPSARMRRLHPRVPDCHFCGNPTTQIAWEAVWPDWGRVA